MSTDGGASWRGAHVRATRAGHGWVRWELPWRPRAAGRYELLARASDRLGAQPATVPFNDGGYQFWAVIRHPVTAV